MADERQREHLAASDAEPSALAPPTMGIARSSGHGPVADAEVTAAELSTAEQPLGPPGPPLNRRSPFLVGLAAAGGVAVTGGLVFLLVTAREMLLLVGLGFFLAAGLEPVVSWLVRRRVPRSAAVAMVLVSMSAIVAGFLTAAIPPLTNQTSRFAQQIPATLRAAQDPQSFVGRLNARYGLADHAQQLLSGQSTGLAQGLLGAGQMAFSALSSAVVVTGPRDGATAAGPQLSGAAATTALGRSPNGCSMLIAPSGRRVSSKLAELTFPKAH